MANINKESNTFSHEDLPEILTAKDIARYLGIGYVKALNLLKYGGLPCVRLGNTYRISRTMFLQWLNEGKGKREFLQDNGL